jgi:hypothetical protein
MHREIERTDMSVLGKGGEAEEWGRVAGGDQKVVHAGTQSGLSTKFTF